MMRLDMEITDNEQLARFILYSRWIRNSEPIKTIKPDAFIPHPHNDLSVTCHKGLSEQGLWGKGQDIAGLRPATLYGRADISAAEVRRQHLDVTPKPVANNSNHAVLVGWPPDKPGQKIIAQELAANCNFIPKP